MPPNDTHDPAESQPATILARGASREHIDVERICVTVLAGPDAGKVFQSDGDRLVVGSHASASARLTDGTVSRFHCDIAVDGKGLVLRDLGSLNGTRVEGVPVAVAYPQPGSRITVGRTELRLEAASETVPVPISTGQGFGKLVGQSSGMRRVFALLERAAGSDATVLLDGETGTGKDLAAESIHAAGPRARSAFVVVDCGAIPGELLESELFGHEKGAFTGATTARDGAFQLADGGTLFLDEIGELPKELQPKLLRALERREVKRVGGARYGAVDVRVIAATNRNLRVEVNAGRFRSDLFYRLAVLEVRMPPLRERREDIPLLVSTLLDRFGTKVDTAPLIGSASFLAELERHDWPGNIRELRNYLERCLAMREAVPLEAVLESSPGVPQDIDLEVPLKIARERWVAVFERRYLAELLDKHAGNVSAAAQQAGVDRAHFYRLLWRHGLK